jgi:NADPH:quinone reductase-like Zn-dependent oxidoreductase
LALPAALVTLFSFAMAKAKQDVADMAAKTHTILIAGGSLVGHAAIKFAIAAGHFVIALVRRGGSLGRAAGASHLRERCVQMETSVGVSFI